MSDGEETRGPLTTRTSCFVALLTVSALLNLPLLFLTFNSNLWDLVFFQNKTTTLGQYNVQLSQHTQKLLINSSGEVAEFQTPEPVNQLSYDCDTMPGDSQSKTIVIFPFRDRQRHLKLALSPIHEHILKQNLSYELYVVEQVDEKAFNRAKLFNVGVREGVMRMELEKAKACNITLKYCLILHDIDLIPMNSKIPYTCSDRPTLLSSGISKFGYKLPYSTYFGGAVAISLNQFKKINGMSNEFWGWGGEDDDFYRRMKSRGFNQTHIPPELGRYRALSHQQATPSKNRFKALAEGKRNVMKKGLMQCEYKVKQIIQTEIFTHIKVLL